MSGASWAIGRATEKRRSGVWAEGKGAALVRGLFADEVTIVEGGDQKRAKEVEVICEVYLQRWASGILRGS